MGTQRPDEEYSNMTQQICLLLEEKEKQFCEVFALLRIVFLEGGNELCISSYSIGLTYALPYIGLLEHPP